MRNLLCPAIMAGVFLALFPGAGAADYGPLWVLEERFDYTLDVTNLGLRSYTVNDTQVVHTLAVTVDEVLNRRPGYEGPEVAPGDTVLVLARSNWMMDDRDRYLLFVLLQARRSYPGLPFPLFEGEALPCVRFQPMFTRQPPRCPSDRALGADHCACAREAAERYRGLLAARKAGTEMEFLHEALNDVNAIIVASAMGILTMMGDPQAMEWMWPLVEHPEYQVRYDLAGSIAYLSGEVAGQIGIYMLNDPEPNVQLIAAFSLGRMAYQPAETKLAEMLEDPQQDRMVRATCINALDRIGSPLLLPALEKAAPAETDSLFSKGLREHLRKQRAKAAQSQER